MRSEFFRFFRKFSLILILIFKNLKYYFTFSFRVVLIHTWNHPTELNDLLTDNSFDYKNWKNNFLFSIITNIYYCVDTFFLLRYLLEYLDDYFFKSF